MASSELAREDYHSPKLLTEWLFLDFPGCMFSSVGRLDDKTIPGCSGDQGAGCLLCPRLSLVVMCVAIVCLLSFKTWEFLKSLLWLFSQGRDTHSGLLPLVLGLKKRSNKAFIWTTPVCLLDSVKVIPSTVMLGRGMSS